MRNRVAAGQHHHPGRTPEVAEGNQIWVELNKIRKRVAILHENKKKVRGTVPENSPSPRLDVERVRPYVKSIRILFDTFRPQNSVPPDYWENRRGIQ